MSIDYAFFNEALRDRFVQFVVAKGIAAETWPDAVEGYVVRLPEEIDDAVFDAIEDEYDALTREQMLLAEADPAWSTRQVMGVEIALSDGRRCMVRIDGAIGRRLSEHFSPEEIQALVAEIAHSIENPATGPLCKIV